MFFVDDFKPEFKFRTENETDDSLVYVVEGNGKIIKRTISKEDYLDPTIRLSIQEEMTREAVMPDIPGII